MQQMAHPGPRQPRAGCTPALLGSRWGRAPGHRGLLSSILGPWTSNPNPTQFQSTASPRSGPRAPCPTLPCTGTRDVRNSTTGPLGTLPPAPQQAGQGGCLQKEGGLGEHREARMEGGGQRRAAAGDKEGWRGLQGNSRRVGCRQDLARIHPQGIQRYLVGGFCFVARRKKLLSLCLRGKRLVGCRTWRPG